MRFPIPLSFDECGKSKYVHLVTFSNGKLESVENLSVPITQPMAVLKGDLASITEQLEQWRDVSQEPPVWLDIEITTDEYLHDIQRKIRALTESLPVEVLLVRRSREQRERVLASQQRETSANSASKRCLIVVSHWKNWMNHSSNVCNIFSPRRCRPSPENTKHENSQPAPEKPELVKGEWKIDFTREPFASNGLFAITGPTGAGKPPCWMPFARRCITKLRAFLTFHNRKMI